VTSGMRAGSFPRESGYTTLCAVVTVAAVAATIAAFFVPEGCARPPR